jgi:hypothetical protein
VIIISVLAAVLVCAYFAVERLNVPEQEAELPPPRETVAIFNADKNDVSEMTLATPERNYTFYKDGDAWRVRGGAGIRLNDAKIDSLAYDFAGLNADEVVGSDGDLSLYGLDAPLGTPSVKLTDGSEKHFVIGGKTPVGTGYYFKTADDGTVYTVYATKIEGFLAELSAYRDATLAVVDPAKLTEIRITRADADILLRAKTAEEMSDQAAGLNAWRMISPYTRDANSYNLEEQIMKKLTALPISKFIEDNPPSYAKYGLDNPKYTVTLTEEAQTPVRVLLGGTVEDEIYVRLDGENSVYTVKAADFSYKDLAPIDFIDTLVYIQAIDNVDTITLTADGGVYVLKIAHNGEEADYFVNDLPADESAFKRAYQEVIGLFIRGAVTDAAGGEPLYTAVFRFNDGRGDDTVEVVPYKDRYAAVRINGKAEYYVMREQAAAVVEKIKNFSQNPGKQ